MSENVRVTTIIAADPQAIYEAWLDSETHAAMTGSAASSDPKVGGEYSAWDGYISGRYLELDPSRRIVAAWRSSEFPPDAPDSLLELSLQEVPDGTELVLVHTELPEGQARSYEQGWSEFYFEPMKRHFERAKPTPEIVPPKPVQKAVARPRAPKAAGVPVKQAAPALQTKRQAAASKPKQKTSAGAARQPAAKAKKKASGTRKQSVAKAVKKAPAARKKARKKPTKKPTKKASRKAPPKRKQPATKKPAKRPVRRR